MKDTTQNGKRDLFLLEPLLMSAIWIQLGTLMFKPAPNVCILSKMLKCRRVEQTLSFEELSRTVNEPDVGEEKLKLPRLTWK